MRFGIHKLSFPKLKTLWKTKVMDTMIFSNSKYGLTYREDQTASFWWNQKFYLPSFHAILNFIPIRLTDMFAKFLSMRYDIHSIFDLAWIEYLLLRMESITSNLKTKQLESIHPDFLSKSTLQLVQPTSLCLERSRTMPALKLSSKGILFNFWWDHFMFQLKYLLFYLLVHMSSILKL